MTGDEIDAMFKMLGKDLGFENPASYLKDRFSAYYTKGILPRAGGLDDQDASFIRDLHRLFLLKRFQYWKLTQGGSGSKEDKKLKKKSWQDVL